MWETLLIHHSKDHRIEKQIDPFFQWKTCQRSLYIGDTRQNKVRPDLPGYETWTGFEAYQFLLEVVTGLRSALFAETEVLHQFKMHFNNNNLPSVPFGDYLSRLRENLTEDAKYVRRNHLMNLGDQSYGGLTHRILSDRQEVLLVGSGQLAEKILPFIKKGGRKVSLAARNPVRRAELGRKYKCETYSLADLTKNRIKHMVIAAPVSMESYLPFVETGACVVDLRDNDFNDLIPKNLDYHSFTEILEALDRTRERHQLLRKQLKKVLHNRTNERKMARFELVHGWEDIPRLAV